MKKIISSILLSISILFLTSCEEDPVTNGGNLNNYTPYKVGAYWLYKTPIQTEIDYYYSEEVISREIDGKYIIKHTYTYIDTLNADTSFYRDTSYIRITDKGMIVNFPDGMERYILKKPYEAGNTWSYKINDSTIYNYGIVDDSLTYITPAGTFTNCLQVYWWLKYKYNPLWIYIFAPNVGIIKFGPYELESYKIP